METSASIKILHIAQERGAALVAARVVHGIAENVTLTWAQTPASALQWLQGNRDTAAVIVEVQAQSCASFVEQLRGLGLTTPVVVVAGSAQLEPALAALNSGADGYVVAGPSLEADLPRTVAAAIERERSRRQLLTQTLTELGARHSVSLARETRICMALQQRLFELESALRKADERQASEAVSFADQLAKRHAEFTASLAQAALSRDARAAELSVATAALDEARQARRADAAAAAEHLRRREAELRADLAEAVAGRTALDTALAEAEAAHQDTRQRAAIDLAAANERQAALEDLLTQEVDRRTSLDRKLAAAEAARQEADRGTRRADKRRSARNFRRDTTTRWRNMPPPAPHSSGRRPKPRPPSNEPVGSAPRRPPRPPGSSPAGKRSWVLDVAEAEAARAALERTLTEAQSAQQHAMQRAAEDLASAAERQAALEHRLAQETDRALGLERQLSAAETARQGTDRQHASELETAGTHLASLQARYHTAVAEHAVAHAALEQRLTDAATAYQQAEERTAAANERQAALEDLLTQETDKRTSLDRKLTAAEAAHQEADRRHAAELTTAAAGLAELQARYDAALEEHAAARAAFERQTAEAASALERASRERTAEAAAAAGQLASMEAELGARLAEAAAARTALERTLTEAQSAQQHAMQRAAEDLASAAARQAALEDRLAQETDRGLGLERQLSAAETARQDTDRRHASELAAAGAQLASLQTRYDTAVTEHAAAHAALEQRLTDAATAHQQAEDRTAAALAAASTREAELVERLTRESDARAALERDLTGARMESARGRDRCLYVISTYRRRAREQKARFEAQLTGERTDADCELRAKDEEIRQIQLEHETLRRLLGTTQDQLQHLHGTVEEERQAHERARLTSESELQRVSAEYGQIRQSFDRLQSAFQTLEQIAGEHAAERARLEAVVADRDSQLSAQAERHRVAEQDAQDALAELQERLRQALDAGGSEIARLQQEIDALRRELDATRTHAEALRGVAERVPDLQTQLERSQNERRRQFERAPYALCRCSQSGAITDANHSFVTLLGCRRVDELRNMDFVAAALDSAGDLGWLLERARTTRKTETVETQWKTREGRRLVVRLQALATTTGSIDIVAEDITGVRALEERLRQAERMEAVGRLASEVAVTCDGAAQRRHPGCTRMAGQGRQRRRPAAAR